MAIINQACSAPAGEFVQNIERVSYNELSADNGLLTRKSSSLKKFKSCFWYSLPSAHVQNFPQWALHNTAEYRAVTCASLTTVHNWHQSDSDERVMTHGHWEWGLSRHMSARAGVWICWYKHKIHVFLWINLDLRDCLAWFRQLEDSICWCVPTTGGPLPPLVWTLDPGPGTCPWCPDSRRLSQTLRLESGADIYTGEREHSPHLAAGKLTRLNGH